eukprot:2043754-Prymnesium_polylepis.1
MQCCSSWPTCGFPWEVVGHCCQGQQNIHKTHRRLNRMIGWFGSGLDYQGSTVRGYHSPSSQSRSRANSHLRACRRGLRWLWFPERGSCLFLHPAWCKPHRLLGGPSSLRAPGNNRVGTLVGLGVEQGVMVEMEVLEVVQMAAGRTAGRLPA